MIAATNMPAPGVPAEQLVSLLQHISLILIGLGGVVAFLSLFAGGLMISGGPGRSATQGFKLIKNSIIGFMVLTFGVAVRAAASFMTAQTTHPVRIPWAWIGTGLASLAAAATLGHAGRFLYRRRVRRIQQREAKEAWASLIDSPGEDGPFEPEEGYEIVAAEKHEDLDEDTKQISVRFHAGHYRFANHSWQRVGLADDAVSYDGSRVFNLEDEVALVSSWFDFCQACAAVNRAAWDARLEQETTRCAEREYAEGELRDEAAELETQRAALAALSGLTFPSKAVDDVLAAAEARRQESQKSGRLR